MKRRVAGLTPVSVEIFTQKVIERQSQTAIMVSPKGSTCEVCGKIYTTENAYRSHLNSKKHKENELKALRNPQPPADTSEVPPAPEASMASIPEAAAISLTVPADATEDDINETIDSKIAAARSRIIPTQCLFCPVASPSLNENIAHMSVAHSFFVPDMEYIVDLPGLLTYLGEKIAVGNVCIYCAGSSREFRTIDAVRKHMIDKGHCKVGYENESERLEISDFYDFTSSYPDADEQRRKRREAKKAKKAAAAAALEEVDEEEPVEWEDVDDDDDDDDEEVDEIVDESTSDSDSDSDDSSDDSDSDLDVDYGISYGETKYQLVLPSGARIHHRSTLRRYTGGSQLVLRRGTGEDPNSTNATVRRLLTDTKSGLVPRKGGNFGAFGSGTEVIKARNAGEARNAGKHVRQYRDQQRREHFKTKVGFRANSQKHFRDPLLQ
ncbi:hypothetical protein EUX98_g3264 [Antrodiella citrinella]|uniref:C2H2-type domain-containing protein n=1 Tax=Antrodiella citrinella TaxID=2447956 RepID=A0A4S4MZ55_9APHY|nr:hypothetical protein EUX98_g3264 [Antrodiella citrinella]